jgi:hypothetical protein
LKFLLERRLSTIPQHQWASKLLGFDFRVEYKPGKMNVVADGLSRRDIETSAEAMALSAPSFQLFEDLRTTYTIDAALTSLRQEVWDGLRGKQWAVVDDLVTRDGRIYVPTSKSLVEELLTTAHSVTPPPTTTRLGDVTTLQDNNKTKTIENIGINLKDQSKRKQLPTFNLNQRV